MIFSLFLLMHYSANGGCLQLCVPPSLSLFVFCSLFSIVSNYKNEATAPTQIIKDITYYKTSFNNRNVIK